MPFPTPMTEPRYCGACGRALSSRHDLGSQRPGFHDRKRCQAWAELHPSEARLVAQYRRVEVPQDAWGVRRVVVPGNPPTP